MSLSACSEAIVASLWVPSAKVTWMASAPVTTWRAVRIWPCASTTTPAPLVESPAVVPDRFALM